MRIVTVEESRAALRFDRLIPALREMCAARCHVPRRQVHEIAGRDGATLTSLVMPAWTEGRHFGVKIVNIAPGNAARGLPALHSSYLLHDATTGAPLALIDGDELTARRTAAASALAASWLARRDAKHLLVVGAGRVARLLPEAYRVVRPFERVSIWARDAKKACALARTWHEQGLDAVAETDLEVVAGRADIVSCATLSREPLIRGRWLSSGSHLDLIGSFTPEMREADDDCFAGTAIYVDTEEALEKCGELLGPMARGVFSRGDVRGTLEALALGTASGRRDATERTVFKSVGSALEDLAAATLVWESLENAVAP